MNPEVVVLQHCTPLIDQPPPQLEHHRPTTGASDGTTAGVAGNVALRATTESEVAVNAAGLAGLGTTAELLAKHSVSSAGTPAAKIGLSLLGFTGVGLSAGMLGGVTAASSPIFGNG